MLALLDTHTFLWFAWGSPRLSAPARTVIEDPANRKFLSAASIWEIAIKGSTGKLALARPFADFLVQHADGNGFETLSVGRAHAVYVGVLPLHHRDPFDRILVAQSLVERMPLISADPALDAYGIARLW